MKNGCEVPFPEKLLEGYEIKTNRIFANVGTDKIQKIIKDFIAMHDEPHFFFLELPSNLQHEQVKGSQVQENFHTDVYYMDGCSQDRANAILDCVGELLIQDGLSSFGFGCHVTHDEIMFGKYNVLMIFCQDPAKYEPLFARQEIPPVAHLTTAWDTFTPETPGTCSSFELNGRTVYDIPKILKTWGLYFAERREDM